jgi:hypothetical protein
MEWIIVPIIVTILVIIWGIIDLTIRKEDAIDCIGLWIGGTVLLLFSWGICGGSYFDGYQNEYKMMNYYENVVIPNAVSEDATTITVTGLDAGMWQAGDISLSSYNEYLVSNRLWDSKPIIKWWVRALPEELKYIRVISGSSN